MSLRHPVYEACLQMYRALTYVSHDSTDNGSPVGDGFAVSRTSDDIFHGSAPSPPPPAPLSYFTMPKGTKKKKKEKRKQKQHFYLQRVAQNDVSALSDCVCRFIHFPGNTVTVVAPTENGQSGDYKEFVSFLTP